VSTKYYAVLIAEPGQTCCIFQHWRDNENDDAPDIEQTRLKVLELLGCANQGKGKISVLGRFGGYVCIADWPGGPGKCPIFHVGDMGIDNTDCFDDQDPGLDIRNQLE
jgi:hypothetical protein